MIGIGQFARQAWVLKEKAHELWGRAYEIDTYVSDTGLSAGEADYELLSAAKAAEEFAATCRKLHERIVQKRADLASQKIQAAE